MATDIKENRTETGLAVFREMREVLSSFPSSSFIQLLPTSAQEMSDLYRPAVTVVKIDPQDQREVYDTPGGGGTVCLHSQALERIANAAGIDFDPTLTHHVHDRVHQPFICEIHVGGWYTDSLGQRRPITAGAVSDLRDGTPTAKVLTGRTGKGLETARQFICERTESRARNRAIRKTTNLPSSFSKDELRKPMVAVRFRLDERDPEARKALIAQGTRASTQVFGTVGPALDAGVARAEEEIIEGQVSEARGGSSEQSATAPAAEVGGSTPPSRSVPVDPEPVDEEPAKPAVDAERAALIRSHVEQLRSAMRWGKEAREKRPTPQQAGLSVTSIAAAIAEPKQLTTEQKKAAWRAVMEQLWGSFGSFTELNSDQVSVVIDWAKASPAEVRELVLFLASSNERIAEIHAALHRQQTLIGGAS